MGPVAQCWMMVGTMLGDMAGTILDDGLHNVVFCFIYVMVHIKLVSGD